MKLYFKYLQILVLFIGYSSITIANELTGREHLDLRLQSEIEGLKKEISEKEGKQLRKVLDRFSGLGVTNRDFFEFLERKLEVLFEKHLRDKNKDEAKVLNDLMRAYASMGYFESSALLEKLRNEARSRGVRNRADQLLDKLDWYHRRNQHMQKEEYYEPNQNLMTHRFLGLINSNEPTLVRWAAEEINRQDGAESVVYDAMKKVLLNGKYTTEGKVMIDALAWLCKILNLYDLDNSAQFLDSISNDPKVHWKLVKYASR